MRPLNRPMFRYGGPIKEGIMDGIREPKKNGGSMMANDEGPRRVALVGNPIYPKGPDGRTNHVLPFIIGQGLRMAARPFGKFVARQFAGPVKQGTQKLLTTAANAGKPIKGGFKAERFDPNFIGKAFINDPLAKTVMGGTSLVGRGIKAGGKGIYNVGKYATTTPSGLAFLGLPVTVSAGRYFLSDGKEIKGDDINKITQTGRTGTSGAPGGGDPGMYLAPQAKGNEGVTLSKEDLRKKRVERYRDIMDIKGMNKDAAYNSLIAASQLINQSGDFKGDIKSGKLINDIIQATSKQFDKPAQTKDAIDTLILKGEIEKDLNKEKNILDNEYKRSAIALNEAKIAQDSLMGDRKSYLEKNKALPSGQMLAGLARNRGYEVADIADVTKVKNWMKENGSDEVAYLKDIMTKTEVAPGVYVINTRLIQVTEDNKLQEI